MCQKKKTKKKDLIVLFILITLYETNENNYLNILQVNLNE